MRATACPASPASGSSMSQSPRPPVVLGLDSIQAMRMGDCAVTCERRPLSQRWVGGRWKLVILFHLFGGKIMRFSDLERAIPAITQKMLGQQLKAMEADGIVLRTAYAQVPPKVEYSLTSWGQSLCPALDAILKWADRRPAHVRKVSETRRPKDGSSAHPRTTPE